MLGMRTTNDLHGVDMNLLVVLDALLAERHVTRAALRINRSQPAVSHALSRLRHLLDDPILVRVDGRLEPTARALEIARPLRDALGLIGGVLGDPERAPGAQARHFHLSMSDYAADALLPSLSRELRRRSPGTRLSLLALGRRAALAAVEAGEIDLAVGVYPDRDRSVAEGLSFALLLNDRFACLYDGAAGPAPTTLDAYLARPHVAVAASPRDVGDVDAALAADGRAREIAITLPHWSVAPALIEGTDLVLTAARRSLPAAPPGDLVVADLPFAVAAIPLVMAWHARRDFDPGHRRLREVLAEACREG
jgi:DNA-binding transcriptional LysR family regulator